LPIIGSHERLIGETLNAVRFDMTHKQTNKIAINTTEFVNLCCFLGK